MGFNNSFRSIQPTSTETLTIKQRSNPKTSRSTRFYIKVVTRFEKCVYRVAHGPPKPCVFKYASQRSMLIENETRRKLLWVLLEYVGDTDTPLSLREYLRDNIVEWSERLRFMRQITLAVALMSQHNMIHGNITTTNILLQLNYQTHQHDIKVNHRLQRHHAQPTLHCPPPRHTQPRPRPPLLRPELFQNSPPTLKSDIYALGTVLWELTYCAIPTPTSHHTPSAPASSITTTMVSPKALNTGAPESLTSLISPLLVPKSLHASLRKSGQRCRDGYLSDQRERATPVIPEHMNSLDAWRDAYLRIRGGLSIENLICVRILHAFLLSIRPPLTYHPIDAATRQAIPCFLLKLAVAKYRDGGAAYKLMECGGMEEKDRWLKLGWSWDTLNRWIYYRALYKDRRIAKEAYIGLGKRWMTWRADGRGWMRDGGSK
ncbi:kinase-like domain-containing protein [Chytridium lagenaria]|nr:kinase-like domain-containing protein [Chytridium lagenaria]